MNAKVDSRPRPTFSWNPKSRKTKQSFSQVARRRRRRTMKPKANKAGRSKRAVDISFSNGNQRFRVGTRFDSLSVKHLNVVPPDSPTNGGKLLSNASKSDKQSKYGDSFASSSRRLGRSVVTLRNLHVVRTVSGGDLCSPPDSWFSLMQTLRATSSASS